MRERFFTPRLRFKSYEELNAWLIDQCITYAKAHRHPELPARRSGKCSRRSGRSWSLCGRFDGFHAVPASVSKTCLVRFDNNQYSVDGERGRTTGRNSRLCDRIVLRQDGRLVAEHPRCFGRDDTIFDPWHYVPVLARKPGALRNGAPSRIGFCPGVDRIRRKLAGADDGDRQMVDILSPC